jgi:hypothetical protein
LLGIQEKNRLKNKAFVNSVEDIVTFVVRNGGIHWFNFATKVMQMKISLIFLMILVTGLLTLDIPINTEANNNSPADVVYENTVYKSFIKTVLCYREGFELSSPVIRLNAEEKLRLSFDDLDSDLKRYKYTIIHCESDWSVSSDLSPSDYIEGFREDNIEDFSYSYNTTAHYTHYALVFPTRNMRPLLSGNYIFRVYIDDPADVAFTRRFSVFETSPAGITGAIRQASEIAERDSRQEVDFTIHLNGMQIPDVDRTLKVIITQNDRWDNAIRNVKPKFTRGDELDYNYDERNTFNGGNEFRTVDIKSLIYQTERILKIDFDTAGYEVILLDDPKRPTKNYVVDKDLNGRKYIKNEEHAQNSDIEADYAWVHFFLPCFPLLPGEVYILGALTDWRLNDASKMSYNSLRRGYEKKLFLKQGYYNYLYVVKDLRTGKADEGPVEGNHWETENEYTIWVYYHEMGGLYDRLIAVQNISSVP